MASDSENWDRYIKSNPKIKIEIQDKYLLNNREMVSSKYLQQLWGVTDKTIRNYIERGMPFSSTPSTGRFKIFDLIESLMWRMQTIDLGRSNVSGSQRDESDSEATQMEIVKANRDKILADAKKSTFEADLSELKYLTLKGELISVEDIDKTMAEQAVLHRTDLSNGEKVLPVMLENLERGAISTILMEANQQRLDDLDKLIRREFQCDETLYDVIEEVLLQLKELDPMEIIEKIRD